MYCSKEQDELVNFGSDAYLQLTDYKFATWRQAHIIAYRKVVEVLQKLTKNCPHLPDLRLNAAMIRAVTGGDGFQRWAWFRTLTNLNVDNDSHGNHRRGGL